MAGHGPELEKLHDVAHELLLQAEDELVKVQKATGKTPSELKRVRKALSNIDWNIQSYGDLIENSLAKYGYDHKPLQKAIRNMEEDTMKAYQLLSDDTIHHLVQQRTGGSLRSDPSVIRGAVRRLEDMFGMEFAQSTGKGGNVRGDLSFSNYAHKSDNNASGLERQTIPKNPDPSTTAHAKGTSGFSKPLTAAEQADEDALVKALAPRVKAQIDMAENAIITDSPRVQAVRNADPRLADAYKPTNTAEDIAAMRTIANSPELQPKIIQSYHELISDRGGIRLQRRLARQFADAVGEVPVAGLVAGPVAGMLLGQTPAEAGVDAIPVISDIESDNTADVSRVGDLFVDKKTNMVMPTAETVGQGKQGLAYKNDKPVAVPYGSLAGEATTSEMTGAFVNQVFEVQKKRFGGIGIGRKKLERQEQLRALPADHGARHGFPLEGGM